MKNGKAPSRPETSPLQEPPHPGYHRTDGRDSMEAKLEIASTDFDGEGERANSNSGGSGGGRTVVSERIALQEQGLCHPTAARVNADSQDSRNTAESFVRNEDEASAAVPTSPSASSDMRPGAVAVPGPEADSYGTTQLSRYTSGADRNAAASGDDDPDVVIVAYAIEEGDGNEGPMTAGRARSGLMLAVAVLVVILAVVVITVGVTVGVMAGMGSFNASTATSPTPSPTASPTPKTTPLPMASLMPSMSSAPTACKLPSTKLLTDDGAAHDYFGYSMSLNANTAIVGAGNGNNDIGVVSGSAYIFIRSGATWAQQTKLVPDDGAANDWFGYSVALDGDTAVIGAYGDDDNGKDSGSVYVFTRTGMMWSQQAKLVPDDGMADDWFGHSVALDGDTAIIGAHRDDDNGVESGSVYVFTRTGTTWTQQAKLLPDDGAAYDEFGRSIAVYGDTAVVGAWGDNDNGHWSGSAYVFTRTGTTWVQQKKLLPDDGARYAQFGFSVAVYEDTAIIASIYDNGSGSAYVFTRMGTTWTQQAKLLPNDEAADDQFGYSVSLDGDTAVIGTLRDDDNGNESGSAYVFTRTGATWLQQKKLLPDDGAGGDNFGVSVAINGTTVFVGAYHDNDSSFRSGSAYAFELC